MNYADYKKYDMLNGKGIRHSLFVSGCTHHCKGCFNQNTWNFNYGRIFDKTLENQIIKDLNENRVNINGLSLLGGEPLDNIEGLMSLVQRVKKECENKTIWIWSGYTFEQILLDSKKKSFIKYCDVLIDGQFKEELKNLKLPFRGSSNQRIVDIQKSLNFNKVMLLENN